MITSVLKIRDTDYILEEVFLRNPIFAIIWPVARRIRLLRHATIRG